MLFGVLAVALIGLPLIWIEFSEVSVVKVAFDDLRVVVVDDSLSIELIVFPMTLVGNFPLRVVEGAIAIHHIVFPLAIVNASRLIEELPIAVADMVFNESFIPGAVLVVLNHEGRFIYLRILFSHLHYLLVG